MNQNNNISISGKPRMTIGNAIQHIRKAFKISAHTFQPGRVGTGMQQGIRSNRMALSAVFRSEPDNLRILNAVGK